MSRLRMDKCARLTAGLGLVVLLAAQEKVGPWKLPVDTPADTVPPATARGGAAEAPADRGANQPGAPADDERPADGDQPKKIRLGFVIPDAAAPRWAAAWHQAELRLGGGTRNGVVACGQRDSSVPDAGIEAPSAPGWHALQLDAAPRQHVVLAAVIAPGPERLLSVITRTGPPDRL